MSTNIKKLALMTGLFLVVNALQAAVPVAVWEGDFNTNQTQGNYTLGLGGCTVVEGGVRVDTAPFSLTNATITTDNKTTFDHTIVMDVVLPQELSGALFTFGRWGANTTYYDSDLIGLYLDNGETWGWWNKGKFATTPVSKSTVLSGEYRLVYRYLSGGSGVRAQVLYVDGEKVYEAANGLRATIGARTISVGGVSVDNSNLLTGLVIKKFALFIENALQEDAQYLDYKFPSEVSAYTANNVSGEKNWSDLPFDNAWANGIDKAAVINLSGDATITLPADLTANKVTFVGNHTVTLVYEATPAVGQWLREDGAKVERIVTAGMVNDGFTVDTGIDYVINREIVPTEEMGEVAVPKNATLVVRNVTTTPKFGLTAMNGKLVIEKGATMVANRSDIVEFHNSDNAGVPSNEVHVYGTLDLGATRQTLYPGNKLYVYGGATVTATVPAEATIDGGANINTINAGAGIVCRKGSSGENAATISAVIGPQGAASTIDVEEGLTITLSATAASSVAMRQQGLIKTGLGTLKIEGNLSTLASIRCDEGTLDIAAGAQPPKVDVASTGTITADNSVAVVLLATDAQLQTGFSTTIAGGASVTCVDPRGGEWELTQDGDSYSIAAVTYTFTAHENSNWSNTANWSTGKVPPATGAMITITTDVTFDVDMTLPTMTAGENVRFGIAANKTLTVSDTTNLKPFFGEGTLKYTSNLTLNSGYTSPFTFAADWTGTLHLAGAVTMQYGDFKKFTGTDKIKLSNATGHLANNTAFDGEIMLENANANTIAMNVNNGDSGKYYKIAKLSGNGTLKVSGGGTATQQTVIANADDFTGDVIITGDVANGNMNRKSVLFGSASYIVSQDWGTIIVAADGSATMANGKRWTVDPSRTMRVRGTLKSTNRDQVKAYGGTTNLIEVATGGVLELVTSGNQNDETNIAYTNITGTGSIKLSGNAGNYHLLPNDPELLWASTLGVINEQPGGMILSKYGTTEEPALYTIGTFSGSKDIRVDYVDVVDSRSLRTIMSADAEWSGMIQPCTTSGNRDRFNTLHVAGADGATAKTLTISGTNFDAQCPNTLDVEATGAVKLTGNWVGNVSVAGTIGGTGSASGTVTFADGATILYTPGESALSATFAAEADATVKVAAAVEDLAGKTVVKVLSWTTKPTIAFELDEGVPKGWIVIQKTDGLYLSLLKPFVISIQ